MPEKAPLKVDKKFYFDKMVWSEWEADLGEHPLEIEGAWARICARLWRSETRGRLGRTMDQWASILRVEKNRAEEILRYIQCEKIGSISPNLTHPNANPNPIITVISRRQQRDERARLQNRKRQKEWYDRNKKQQPNRDPNGDSLTTLDVRGYSLEVRNKQLRADALVVLAYLNKVGARDFKPTKTNLSGIRGRLKNGATVEECKTVLDYKSKDPFFIENPRHYNPITLFRASKWDVYTEEARTQPLSLNNQPPPPPAEDKHSQKYDQWVKEADEGPIPEEEQAKIDKMLGRQPQEGNP